jgi:hypothetical protein
VLIWPESEADHSIPSRAVVKNGGAIQPFPRRYHGVMLNELITETTLSFTYNLFFFNTISGGVLTLRNCR